MTKNNWGTCSATRMEEVIFWQQGQMQAHPLQGDHPLDTLNREVTFPFPYWTNNHPGAALLVFKKSLLLARILLILRWLDRIGQFVQMSNHVNAHIDYWLKWILMKLANVQTNWHCPLSNCTWISKFNLTGWTFYERFPLLCNFDARCSVSFLSCSRSLGLIYPIFVSFCSCLCTAPKCHPSSCHHFLSLSICARTERGWKHRSSFNHTKWTPSGSSVWDPVVRSWVSDIYNWVSNI